MENKDYKEIKEINESKKSNDNNVHQKNRNYIENVENIGSKNLKDKETELDENIETEKYAHIDKDVNTDKDVDKDVNKDKDKDRDADKDKNKDTHKKVNKDYKEGKDKQTDKENQDEKELHNNINNIENKERFEKNTFINRNPDKALLIEKENDENKSTHFENRVQNFFESIERNIKEWFLDKTNTYQKRVDINSDGGTFYDFLNHAEEMICRKKFMGWIMPFIEFIFIFYLVLFFIYVILSSKVEIGYEVFSLVPLCLCGLCLVKRKYGISFLGLLSIIIERIYVQKKYYDYINMLGDRLSIAYWILVLETFFLIFLLVKLVEVWYQSDEGKKIRFNCANFLLKSMEEPKETIDEKDINVKSNVLNNLNNLNNSKNCNHVLSEKKEIDLKELKIQYHEVLTLDEEVIKQLKDNINSDLASTSEVES